MSIPLVILRYLLLSSTALTKFDTDVMLIAVEVPGLNNIKVEGLNWFSDYDYRYQLLQRNDQCLGLGFGAAQ